MSRIIIFTVSIYDISNWVSMIGKVKFG